MSFEQVWAATGRMRHWLESGKRISGAKRQRRRVDLESLEVRCLLSGVVDFATPTANAAPYGITAGPNDTLWFTETGVNKIGEINAATDTITEYPVENNSSLNGIALGSDGNLWFTDSGTNSIGMINSTTDAIVEYPLPTKGSFPFDITSGPDGNLWFTEQSGDRIGMINPQTHAISQFEISTTSNTLPTNITTGPDGNLWFTEQGTGSLASINPTTDAFAQYPITDSANQPFSLATGSDGNVWFTSFGTNTVQYFDPGTDTFSMFPVPTDGAGPLGMAAGPDGDIYFTEYGGDQIGAINPATDVITEVKVPTAGSEPYGITTGPDGNIWFTEAASTASKIGVDELPIHLAVSSQPTGDVTAGNAFDLSVSAEYASGAVDQAYTGQVAIALVGGPPGTTLGGTLKEPFASGVAGFSGLTLDEAADNYTVQATSSDLAAATSGSIDVIAAAGSKLVLTAQPTGDVVAGDGFSLTAEVEDPFNNLATSYDGALTVALTTNPGNSTLAGTTRVTVASTGSTPGYATFSGLSLNNVGNGYQLTVSGNKLTDVTTGDFNVVAPVPARVVVTSQPPGTVSPNEAFGLSVEVEDQSGAAVLNYGGTVTVALAGDPGGGALGGTTTMSVSPAGYATFSGLTLNYAGSGYTLMVSASGLPATTTTGINVVAPTPTITAEPVYTQKLNKKGKKVGKPVFAGYMITFSTAMNEGTLANSSNYVIDTVVPVKKTKKKPATIKLTPIRFSVTGETSNTVTLKPAGTPFASKAGQIALSTSLESSVGAFLAPGEMLSIAKGGKKITLA